MLLVLDAGNTNITLGIFNGKELVKKCRLVSDTEAVQTVYEAKIGEVVSGFDIKGCIIGSVVDELNEKLKNACDNLLGINSFLCNNKMDFGIKVLGKDSSKAGMDRIANALCAKNNYPLPAIVVDAGTAVTFDIVSKEGEFIGGVIMPGIGIEFKALAEFTSKLPEIEPQESEKAIGDSTESCILSGVVRGTACGIEGLLSQCEKELGEKATVIATGGRIELLAKYMSRKFDYINPDLTLEGLREIFEYQRVCKN